jgi:hypothetical protein
MRTSNNKILTIAVLLLLIANIALVAFMVMGKKKCNNMHRGGKGNPAEMMAKELNMTEQQKKDHKQLKEQHLKTVRPLFDSLRVAKMSFYALIKEQDVSDSIVHVYSQRINEKQSAINKLTFAHFKRMRKLFTAEQQPRFDELVQKMMQQHGRMDSATKMDK